MPTKLIIDNRTNMPTQDVMPYVREVLQAGRISNDGKQYCYATVWPDIVITSHLNQKSDRLIITYNKENTNARPDSTTRAD